MTEPPKTILITGAASGIGRATAELFAARGWRVGLADIDESRFAAVVDGLPGDLARGFALDVTRGQARGDVMGEFDAWAGPKRARTDAGACHLGELA